MADRNPFFRWALFLAFVVVTGAVVSSALHNTSEAFWVLFPVWVAVGAIVFRLFPLPHIRGRMTTRLMTGAILVATPPVLYLGLVHLAGARASIRELLLGVYFFAFSFEAFLLYVFQAFDLVAAKLVKQCRRRWKLSITIGTRLVLYSLLIPFLVSTFAIHRFKILPNVSDPVVSTMALEDVGFSSRDERPCALRGWFFPLNQANGTILLCHGVGANRGDLRDVIQLFHEARFQVLAFDFRGHGESDGHTVTYGHAEKYDVLGAYDYLLARTDVDSDSLFAVGVSMGAASLLLALPDMPLVRAAVVDSAYAELESMARRRFRLFPVIVAGPLTRLTEFFAWVETGVNVRSVSPLVALGRITIPLFFFHGGDDTVIPVSETQRLFAAYAGQKRLHIEYGVPHAGTAILNPGFYQRETRKFFLESIKARPSDSDME